MVRKVPTLFLLIFTFIPQVFAQSPVATYDELLRAIRETRAASQARITAAVEQEKVREAWETGKLIDGHILQHKERADYGNFVIEKLARDLGTDRTELYRMLSFARVYPIVVPGQQLSWSHYKALLPITDSKEREKIAEEAVRASWDRDRLREEIHRRGLVGNPEEINSSLPPLKVQKGILDTHRIVMLGDQPVISLGFNNYLELSGKDAKQFKEGDIIRVSQGKPVLVESATESLVPFHLFSYRAKILEVTDGDTFWALVDLGFGFTTKQQLRFRGLDAPEIESKEGAEAKTFLESLLADPESVIITASRSDKYDRYLTDVWVGKTYVNQELLDKGHALRVNE